MTIHFRWEETTVPTTLPRSRSPNNVVHPPSTYTVESGFEAHALYSPTAREVGLIIQDALSKNKWVWLILCTLHTRSRERVKMEHHVSCVIRSPKTVIHTIVLLWHCPPLELACLGMYLSFLVWCDTFCSTEGRRYLQSIWEKTTWQRLGSAVSLHLSALCCCRSIPISRHILRSEAQAVLKTGRRGVLMIQVRL